MYRYCAPANDILYFLYCNTSAIFRREETNNLLKIYYETLKASLIEANVNTDIFTWENLKKSIEKIKLSCMIQSFATMTVSLLGIEASNKRTKKLLPISKIISHEFETNEKYQLRMTDNLLDLCRNLDDIVNC